MCEGSTSCILPDPRNICINLHEATDFLMVWIDIGLTTHLTHGDHLLTRPFKGLTRRLIHSDSIELIEWRAGAGWFVRGVFLQLSGRETFQMTRYLNNSGLAKWARATQPVKLAYQLQSNQGILCELGTIAPLEGSTHCEQCGLGEYANTTGMSRCHPHLDIDQRATIESNLIH